MNGAACPSCRKTKMMPQTKNRRSFATLMKCPKCGFQCRYKFLGAISRNYAAIADELGARAEEAQGIQKSRLKWIALVSYFSALELFVSAWLRDNLDTKKIGMSKECYLKIHWKISERLTKGFKDATGKKVSSESPRLLKELEIVRDRRNSIVHGGKFSLATVKEELKKSRKLFFDTVQLLSITSKQR
ncbi:MAG: hypothetical protein Q8K98_06565 [Bacteroidota bacterium]|nr:hypothetical protein [Bacteroidota bacterium]